MAEPPDRAIGRLAVIGDVHAADGRLERALRTAAALAPDRIACTGDIVDGAGSVERCCALLRDYDVACVRGNHDRWLFTGLMRFGRTATQLHTLSNADRQYLQALPATRVFPTERGSLLLCHGIGEFDLGKITSLDTPYALRSNRLLKEVIAQGHAVMVNGHSHEHLVVREGGLVIVNAGAIKEAESCGLLLLDVPANRVEWHSLAESPAAVAGQAIFL